AFYAHTNDVYENNTVDGAGDAGFQLPDADNVTVRGASVNDTGVGVGIGGQQSNITDTTVTNSRVGAVVRSATDATLTDVTATDNEYGVGVIGSPGMAPEDVSSTDNEYGVGVTDSTGATLTDVTATDNELNDTVVQDSAVDMVSHDVGSAEFDAEATDVALDGVESPPSDPAGRVAVGEYVRATNTSTDGRFNVSFGYNDADLTGIESESTLSVWRYDGGWNEVGGSEVSTGDKEVAANISSFSVFAPAGQADTGGGSDYNQPPSAEYEVDESPVAGEPVTLNASESSDEDGEITDYKWEIDGSPDAEGEVVEQTFDEPGLYEVVLTVEDDGGKQGTTEDVLRVQEPEDDEEEADEDTDTENESDDTDDEEETDDGDEPEGFDLPSDEAAVNEKITLRAADSLDMEGEISEYEWTVDDETIGNESVVTHVLESSGEVNISLTVTDDTGENETYSRTVSVDEAEEAVEDDNVTDNDTTEDDDRQDTDENTTNETDDNGEDDEDDDDDGQGMPGFTAVAALLAALVVLVTRNE
ncbi:MAG: PKD domain-containing protein, partial [Halobacteria archaeon]